MKIIDLSKINSKNYQKLLNRKKQNSKDVFNIVNKIIKKVKKEGNLALKNYTFKFDKCELKKFKISKKEIKKAIEQANPKTIKALKIALKNIDRFHKIQILQNNNGKLWREWRAIQKIGIYVPGNYPSSVLMMGIPAKIAGCKNIIMCTPCDKQGKISPTVLLAANLVGIKNIFKVGGAQAIAAMAYGTETIPKVDKIFGPGNKYVTIAKIIISQDIAIDMPAGPSEIMILADKSANPKFVSVDLLSQIEHGQDSIAIFLTTSLKLAKQIARLKINGFVGLIPDLKTGIKFINDFAPEHLELMTKKNKKILKKIQNAGSVFLGNYSPVSAGDYCSGTNHVLPTNGFAKSFSGLNVESFGKWIEVQELTKKDLKNISKSIFELASIENMPKHAKAVKQRLLC